MNKKIISEQGYITIEATIVLSIYLFAFFMLFSFIHLCRAQMKLSIAVNNAAKEISQYSYLYGMTGLNESIGNLAVRADGEKEDYSTIASDLGKLYDQISRLQNGGASGISSAIKTMDVDNVYSQLDNAKSHTTEIASILKDKMKNPRETLMGVAAILGSGAAEEVKNVVAENLAKALVKNNLKSSESDGDGEINAFLHHLGIKKVGKSYLDSIDFSKSRLYEKGTNEIKIIAKYQVQLLPLLNLDTSFEISQTARTRGWLLGDSDKK